MTATLRSTAILALVLTLLTITFSGMASAQDPECTYLDPRPECEDVPPPPEIGVQADADEEEEPEPEVQQDAEEPEEPAEPAVTCDDIIEAVANGDTSMDQDGDGDIDGDDLIAAGCTCEEIEAAIAAGDLPADALPEECAEVAVLADTGIESAGMAAMAAAALLGGAVMVMVTRRTA